MEIVKKFCQHLLNTYYGLDIVISTLPRFYHLFFIISLRGRDYDYAHFTYEKIC